MSDAIAFQIKEILREIKWLLILICVITAIEKGAFVWEVCYRIWSHNRTQIVCPPSDKHEGTFL